MSRGSKIINDFLDAGVALLPTDKHKMRLADQVVQLALDNWHLSNRGHTKSTGVRGNRQEAGLRRKAGKILLPNRAAIDSCLRIVDHVKQVAEAPNQKFVESIQETLLRSGKLLQARVTLTEERNPELVSGNLRDMKRKFANFSIPADVTTNYDFKRAQMEVGIFFNDALLVVAAENARRRNASEEPKNKLQNG